MLYLLTYSNEQIIIIYNVLMVMSREGRVFPLTLYISDAKKPNQ